MKLEVPVGIYPTNGTQMLVVGGGQYESVDFPIRPYEYALAEATDLKSEEVKLIGGGSARIRTISHPVIPTKGHADEKTVPTIDYVLELVKDHPDMVRKLVPDPYVPYPMFFDIETDSKDGHFSKKERDEIISIQVKFPDTDAIMLMQYDNDWKEADLLEMFLNLCIESPTGKRPDLLVGYNCNRFDVPYLKERIRRNAREHGVLRELFTKAHRTTYDVYYPTWIRAAKRRTGMEIDLFRGLVTLDIYLHAKDDLALRTLPSRSLERVALAYGAKDVVELAKEQKGKMRELLINDKPLFTAYAKDDVIQTEYLYNIYSQRVIASANLLSCPMTMIHHASSGQKSYIVLYRECRKHGYYSVQKNKDRYDGLYERAPKYQGAMVDCFKTGYFDKTVYVDCKSMYPNIMHDYNLSFDKYVLEEILDYPGTSTSSGSMRSWSEEAVTIGADPDVPRIFSTGTPYERTVYIPDDNYKCVLKFRIDFVNDGFMRTLINRYNGVRDMYKTKSKQFAKKYRESGDDLDRIQSMMYDSMQQEAKTLNNTFYGVLAQKYYEVADLPAAIFVTAIGRWIMSQMVEMFGPACIEIDTDGLLLDRTKIPEMYEDIARVNDVLRKRQADFFGLQDAKMKFQLEFEGAGSVYMYKQKNYILRKDEDQGKLATKGSAFTGYDKAPVILRAVKIISEAVMRVGEYGKLSYDEARRMAMDIRKLPLSAFKFTKTMKKNPNEYKGYEGIYMFVRDDAIDTYADKDRLKLLKAKARDYVDNRFKENKKVSAVHDIKSMKQLIRDCVSEDQLDTVLQIISEIDHSVSKTKNPHFMLNLIMRHRGRGHIMEEDDIIEYYYTRTSDQYSLADDVADKSQLDLERYEHEIGLICERFSLADPVHEALTLDIF